MKNKHFSYIFIILFLLNTFILNALGNLNIQEDNEITPKMLREIKIMEKRHFKGKIEDESDKYRLERLEIELLGNSYEDIPTKRRMERLKLASQKRMLTGFSIPRNFDPRFTPKKVENDSIEIVKKDDVGIIDGLLKLYAPDFYEHYSQSRRRYVERYWD